MKKIITLLVLFIFVISANAQVTFSKLPRDFVIYYKSLETGSSFSQFDTACVKFDLSTGSGDPDILVYGADGINTFHLSPFGDFTADGDLITNSGCLYLNSSGARIDGSSTALEFSLYASGFYKVFGVSSTPNAYSNSGDYFNVGENAYINGYLSVIDSLTIGSGKFINKIFQSAGGDSLGIIYYNTILSRTDTVWAPNEFAATASLYKSFLAQKAKIRATNATIIDGGESFFKLLFDDSADDSVSWGCVIDDYNSGTISAEIYFSMASATSGNVVFGVQVWAYTPGDAADIATESYDIANLDTVVVPATAGYMKKCTITLSNKDSIAKGDMVRFRLYRDADNASDTATGDAEVYVMIIKE